MSDKIQPSHLARRAVVYLRQSDPRQVRNHPESTARQYALQRRAAELGWPSDRIDVIDEDLGQSATSAERRSGFKRLEEDVSHGRVGAIFALEVSRLARSSADWYRLLDLCGLADVVLIDEQSVYTPLSSDDRLLLGLKGAMSEAEQSWMRLRLYGGKLNKARRGELRFHAPTGYVWDEAQRHFRFDPDEHVQRAVRLLFERFRLDGSAYAVVRYFAQHGLQMPTRDPATQELQWYAPRYHIVLRVLSNPTYAGAYVYGRHERCRRLINGQARRSVRQRAQEAWTVCVYNHHPAYISWEEFMANRRKLSNNAPRRLSDQSGAPRKGTALLQGLVLCGKCGHKMTVSYGGRVIHASYNCHSPMLYGGEHPRCWSVAARPIDDAVAKLFLDTVQGPEIELGLAVVHEAERQAAEVERQWKLRLDRARYETRLAERRYKAVDPDNRTVARTLEREWNDKLQELAAVERAHQEARQQDKLELSVSDRARVLALAKDLRQVWNAETTTHADRKNLLRMLVQQVTLTPIDIPERTTRIQVLWRTGAVSDFIIPRPRWVSQLTNTTTTLEVIQALVNQGPTDAQLAEELNRRGLRNFRGRPWRGPAIQAIRRRHGLQRSGPCPSHMPLPEQRADGLYSVRGVAARLDVPSGTVRYWIKRGWLRPTDTSGHAFWFQLDPTTLSHLQALRVSHPPSSRLAGGGRPRGVKSGTILSERGSHRERGIGGATAKAAGMPDALERRLSTTDPSKKHK